MRLACVFGVLLVLLPACSIKYDYSPIPELRATSNAKVAIAVQDKRQYILAGEKTPNFVGLQRGGYGNPFSAYTKSGKPLAENVATSIFSGFALKQIEAVPVSVRLGATREQAIEALLASGATRLLLISLNEWKTDTFISINLVYDLSAEVLDGEGNLIGENSLRGADFLEGSAWDPRLAAQDTIPQLYQEYLASLLNSDQIVAALDPSSPATRSGAGRLAAASYDHDKVVRFLKYNGKVLSKLSAYNETHKIGRNNNTSTYRVTSIDAVKVLALEGGRATVTLNFTVGRRTDPSAHKQTYDIGIDYDDIDIIRHRELTANAPRTEIVTSAQKDVPPSADNRPKAQPPTGRAEAPSAASQTEGSSVADTSGLTEMQLARLPVSERRKIERYFDSNERRARGSLRKYNEKHNIGQGGYYDDHRIMLINDVEVVGGDGDVFNIKISLSVGNHWSSSYFRYLYTARLVGNALQVLDHKEL